MSTLETFDYVAFRRTLLRLSDPDQKPGATEKTEIRETAHRIVGLLPRVFGESLDRTTLWSRIDSAISTACAKVGDGDVARWWQLVLEHIKADAARVACCEPIVLEMATTSEARPLPWRQALIAYFSTHRIPVVVHGRLLWERSKAEANMEAKASNKKDGAR